MDSTEQSQVIEDSTEQPNNTVAEGSDEQGGLDYEKQYKELQAEYTKLRQEQKPAEETQDDIDRNDIIKSLKEDYGLMTKEDFDNIESKKERNSELDRIVSDRPELAGLKNAIRQLGENGDKSWDEVIKENFNDVPLVAGNPGIVGGSNIPSRQKEAVSVKDMTREEFARYKQETGIGNSFKRR